MTPGDRPDLDRRVVILGLDASDPAYPGFVVEIGRVIDPDRTVIVERIGSFDADDSAGARRLSGGKAQSHVKDLRQRPAWFDRNIAHHSTSGIAALTVDGDS